MALIQTVDLLPACHELLDFDSRFAAPWGLFSRKMVEVSMEVHSISTGSIMPHGF